MESAKAFVEDPSLREVTTKAGRVVLIELQDSARPVIDAYLAEITAVYAAEFAVLTAVEREQLINLLSRLSAHIQTLDVEQIA